MRTDKLFQLKTVKAIFRWQRNSKFRRMLGNNKAILEILKHTKNERSEKLNKT